MISMALYCVRDVRILRFLSLHQSANFDKGSADSPGLQPERNIGSASIHVHSQHTPLLFLHFVRKKIHSSQNRIRFSPCQSPCPSSNRQHYEIDDCLEDNREDY